MGVGQYCIFGAALPYRDGLRAFKRRSKRASKRGAAYAAAACSRALQTRTGLRRSHGAYAWPRMDHLSAANRDHE